MSDSNKTYRIKTEIGNNVTLHVNINQDYEHFNILSLKISKEGMYRMHTSNYGCIAGRVLANEAFGIPNAKVSVFIPNTNETNVVIDQLYPYKNIVDKDSNEIRYNLLPSEQQFDCHQPIGTFPTKRMVLDNNDVLEMYDKYYKYTTVTNESGDYMLFGIPVGEQVLHVELDLSDIGILSQKPRDLMYQGYNKEQFESPIKFKSSTNLDSLPQVISQNFSVYVNPFWGEESETDKIAITRNDMNVSYKFTPTCVFMGSLIYDSNNNAIAKNCTPQVKTGLMDELETGSGRIEMIRKTENGEVESYAIQGEQLIDGSGTWCYQIPMNLDYMGTDEYGNMVPTNDPKKGIPTRTRVRFRFSLNENDNDYSQTHLVKVLVPNNPIGSEMTSQGGDYNFGSATIDDEYGGKSFRDLFFNNVYTVKTYIPRLQRGHSINSEKFTGFKLINTGNGNNPLPYNNMRVKISFMFVLQCMILKTMITMVTLYNRIIIPLRNFFKCTASDKTEDKRAQYDESMQCMTIGGEVCPQLEQFYFAPGCKERYVKNLAVTLKDKETQDADTQSLDYQNSERNNKVTILTNVDHLMQCVEVTLALEYNVIKFDFYNDWINGMLYFPRWMASIKKKRSFLFGLIKIPAKIQGCVEGSANKARTLDLVQQCSLRYSVAGDNEEIRVNNPTNGCVDKGDRQKCHKTAGREYFSTKRTKLVQTAKTIDDKTVYYLKSFKKVEGKNIPLFATDIVMLGSMDEYSENGGINIFNKLTDTTFTLPPNIALTTLEDDTVQYELAMKNGIKNIGDVSYDSTNTATSGNDGSITNNNNRGIPLEIVDSANCDIEQSGIDWGYYPKINGKNPTKTTSTTTYTPGGHFLSISCSNASTNINSCVNLSRVCELGGGISEREDYYAYKSNGTLKKYRTLESTGLISDSSIKDVDSRSIFATLNSNHLRSVIDNETGFRRYDFIPLYPNGFSGELKNKVNTSHITNGDVENIKLDYNRFRYGLMVKNGDSNSQTWITRNKSISKKFVREVSGGYKMPIYDNSFYFYFGLSKTQTALRRFMNEYYAECPKNVEKIDFGEDNIEEKVYSVITYEFNGIGKNNYGDFLQVKNQNFELSNNSTSDKVIFVGKVTENGLNANFAWSNDFMYIKELGKEVTELKREFTTSSTTQTFKYTVKKHEGLSFKLYMYDSDVSKDATNLHKYYRAKVMTGTTENSLKTVLDINTYSQVNSDNVTKEKTINNLKSGTYVQIQFFKRNKLINGIKTDEGNVTSQDTYKFQITYNNGKVLKYQPVLQSFYVENIYIDVQMPNIYVPLRFNRKTGIDDICKFQNITLTGDERLDLSSASRFDQLYLCTDLFEDKRDGKRYWLNDEKTNGNKCSSKMKIEYKDKNGKWKEVMFGDRVTATWKPKMYWVVWKTNKNKIVQRSHSPYIRPIKFYDEESGYDIRATDLYLRVTENNLWNDILVQA